MILVAILKLKIECRSLPLAGPAIASVVFNAFVKESLIHASPERVFAFHEQPEVLELLLPPWESARVIKVQRFQKLARER